MASRKRTASKQIDRTSRYVFTPPTGRCASCRNSCGRTFQLQLAQPQMTLCCASCFWKADVADTQQQSRESGQHRGKNSGTQKKRILAKGSNFHRVSPISKSVLLIATRLCYITETSRFLTSVLQSEQIGQTIIKSSAACEGQTSSWFTEIRGLTTACPGSAGTTLHFEDLDESNVRPGCRTAWQRWHR